MILYFLFMLYSFILGKILYFITKNKNYMFLYEYLKNDLFKWFTSDII